MVGNYGSFVHTDPLVFSSPSSDIANPEGQISSPVLNVMPMQYHAACVSIVAGT
jgi:hypothetical protein